VQPWQMVLRRILLKLSNRPPDGAGRVVAHAVVNAVLAVAQGNNTLTGAAGVASGEVVGNDTTDAYYC